LNGWGHRQQCHSSDVAGLRRSYLTLEHHISPNKAMNRILTSLAILACVAGVANAAVYINEVCPNAPGSDSTTTTGNEFFELRGTPNMSLAGYFLLSLEGQGGTNRGDINQYFDLGSFSLGANGYLFARQAGSKYTATDLGATVIANTIGTGWGRANAGGVGSSVGHYSDGTQRDLENGATTILLINIGSGIVPTNTMDLDTNEDGFLDLPTGWTVVDSVGIMDGADGAATDYSYGAITFRAPSSVSGTHLGTCAYSNIIDVPGPLTTTAGASYVGRKGESIGSTTNDWVGAILDGVETSPLDFVFYSASDPAYNGMKLSDMVYGGTNASAALLGTLAYTPTINGTRFTNYTDLPIGGPIGAVAVDPRDNTTILFTVDNDVGGGIYRAYKVASGNWRVDSTPVVTNLVNPSGLVVEPNGTLWWVHDYTASLMRLKAPWSANMPELVVTNFGNAVTDDDPADLTFAPAGFTGRLGQPNCIVVADRGSDGDTYNALNLLLDPSTTELYQTNNHFLVGPTPAALGASDVNAIDSLPQSGEVVTLSTDGFITAVDANGTTRTIIPTAVALTAGRALAVDPVTGRLWAADDVLDEVWSVDPSLSGQTADAKELSFPLVDPPIPYRQIKFHDAGMAFAANGQFLVVSDNSTAGGGGRLLIFHKEPFVIPLPPSITANPTNQSVPLGQAALFSVAVSGTEPFAYQWFKDGTNLMAGATAAELSLSNVESDYAGNYSVLVTNAYGATNSSEATLTVLLPPGITSNPTNQSVPLGQTALFSVAVSGTEPFAYQWFKDGTNLIAGATVAELSLSNVESDDAGGYSVLVTNAYGATNSSVATLTVLLPPSITTNPINQSVPRGQTALFSVTVSGTEPFAYQWFKNETNVISGATAAVLSLSNVQSNDAGGYSVLVTNAYGATNSSVATLTVLFPPVIVQHPQSRAAVVGGSVQFTVSATGNTNRTYQWQHAGTNLVDQTNSLLTLVNLQVSDFGDYRAVVSNPDGSTPSNPAQLTQAVRPQLTPPEINLSTVYLSFPTEIGPVYEVEYKILLEDPIWQALTTLSGTGGTLSITDNNVTNATRFYRVRVR
jgi:hypothetical protein